MKTEETTDLDRLIGDNTEFRDGFKCGEAYALGYLTATTHCLLIRSLNIDPKTKISLNRDLENHMMGVFDMPLPNTDVNLGDIFNVGIEEGRRYIEKWAIYNTIDWDAVPMKRGDVVGDAA